MKLVEAYILLTSAIGKVREVFDKIKTLGSVKDVRIVTGPFDIVVFVEADDMSTLTNTVVEEIREIDGVVDSNTAIVVE